MDGMNSKTRKGDREIISVSIPVSLYDAMQEVCERKDLNRSAMITTAISNYLKNLSVKVGEQ